MCCRACMLSSMPESHIAGVCHGHSGVPVPRRVCTLNCSTCSMQPLTTADHAVSTVTVNAFARFRVVRCAAHRRRKAEVTLASYNIHHTLHAYKPIRMRHGRAQLRSAESA